MRAKETIHIMLDVETTGLNPYKHRIWQLGVAKYDPIEGFEYTEWTINPSQFVEAGHFELDTVDWQGKQNRANWEEAKTIDPVYGEAWLVERMATYIQRRLVPGIRTELWSKGSFDFNFLHAAAERADLGLLLPWGFRQENDLRTLCNVLNSAVPKFDGAHRAGKDAWHQLEHLMNLLSRIQGV